MAKVTLNIRLDDKLREEFMQACKAEHLPASIVLRRFIKQFVDNNPPVSKNIPNIKTIASIEEADKGVGVNRCKTADELFEELGI